MHVYTIHIIIQSGDFPLGIAAEKGHIQTVQRLLEARANVNQQNKVMIMYIGIRLVHFLRYGLQHSGVELRLVCTKT